MKLGKLQESILDRSVFKQLHKTRKEILLKPKAGLGYQLISNDTSLPMAQTVNVIEGEADEVAYMIVPRAIGSMAASHGIPAGIQLCLVLPESLPEQQLRHMIHVVDEQCVQAGLELCGGHTQISSSVTKVIAAVTAFGFYDKDVYVPEIVKGKVKIPVAKAGQDIVMTGYAGLLGTWLLEKKHHDAFVAKYNPDIADTIKQFHEIFSVLKEAKMSLAYGAQTLYDLSEGGVFGGLWEVAAAGNVGLRVDLKKIPLKQETVELCDFVDVNPYQLVSMGSLLIAADHGEDLVGHLNAAGVPAVVIGQFTDNNDRVIMNDDEVRYLEPPRGSKMI